MRIRFSSYIARVSHFLVLGLPGVAGVIGCHPFDTVKVKIQVVFCEFVQ